MPTEPYVPKDPIVVTLGVSREALWPALSGSLCLEFREGLKEHILRVAHGAPVVIDLSGILDDTLSEDTWQIRILYPVTMRKVNWKKIIADPNKLLSAEQRPLVSLSLAARRYQIVR